MPRTTMNMGWVGLGWVGLGWLNNVVDVVVGNLDLDMLLLLLLLVLE
jgi:hypothetical protein